MIGTKVPPGRLKTEIAGLTEARSCNCSFRAPNLNRLSQVRVVERLHKTHTELQVIHLPIRVDCLKGGL
jgi:hypothetical protein